MQVVLHARDSSNVDTKNITRNLGLQSIVKREDIEVDDLLQMAVKQRSTSLNLIDDYNRLNNIATKLNAIALQLQEVIVEAYTQKNRINFAVNAVNTSGEYINSRG